ncbi:thymidine kinase-like [Hibiscus syriacus]|uniref:Thymidine kinase-like n=1 Tax=Hibiscus syriacus TaxID=106335 RepID=A0A6A2ZU12_HIBSY|nr:thymidine kinase-like [Hibiscus syriacus]
MDEIGIDPCAANPGPIDPSVLYDQEKHVSSAVWDGQERGALRCHEHTSKLGEWRLTLKQIELVEKAGFGYLRKIPAISLDNPLISALVERWRRETNTFHFTVGEMTVTLQDVAFLLGLAIDGKPVIGITYTTCGTVCEKYLGKAPDSTYASGGMVKLRNKVPVMYLPLFENFEEAGRYAWGAAALAFLYRALGNASVKSQSTICGCLTLLQCWSYYHLNIGRPKLNRDPIHDHFPFVLRWKGKQSGPTTNRDVVFYRKALDSLEPCDVEWLPYKYMDKRHLPNRVLRQYGMLQPIPEDVAQWVRKSRGVDGGVDLSGKMESELSEWEDRALHIVEGDDDADENESMVWYMGITRKVVGRPISLSSEFQRTIGGVREISYLADTFPLKGLQPEQFESISRIRAIAQECLRDQVGGQIVVSPIGGTELGKGVGGRRSEDESQYCGMVVEVDHLHIQHEDNEVHLLPFCTTVVEGENGLLLEEHNKVDDMQLRDATDGIDASQFCDEINDVDHSNIPDPHAISEIDLQNNETAENVIPQSSDLPNVTNDTNGSEIHNTNEIPDDSQLCNATDGVNDPQTQVATDVNESETHHATENIGELQPSYVSIHSDQQTVKVETETVPQLPHENIEDLPQPGETSVV